MTITSACKVVKDNSRNIWNLILRGKQQGIKIQEETITEILLLDLAEKFGDQMKITLFNKNQEGKNGSDWEWYIKKKGVWLGFSVQAKILNYENDMYDSLFYQNQKTKEYQIDKLIIHSFKKNLIPIYSFYNYTEIFRDPIRWRYFYFPIDSELIGWSYATATDVYKFKKRGKAGILDFDLGRNSELMSKPFCEITFFESDIEKMISNIRNELDGVLDENTDIAELIQENNITEVPNFGFKNLNELPPYVQELYEGEGNIRSNKEEDPLYIIILDLDIDNKEEGF